MNLTQVIVALMGLATVLITTFLIPYIKTKTTKEQRETLITVIKTGVMAAEQIFTGTGLGEQKKAWVIQYLKDKGIKIDLDAIGTELNALIESAVYEMNNDKVAN